MLRDALNHRSGATAGLRRRRYDWWNSPPLRTLDEERAIVAIQLTDEDSGEPRKGTTRARKSGATAVRKRGVGAARKKR